MRHHWSLAGLPDMSGYDPQRGSRRPSLQPHAADPDEQAQVPVDALLSHSTSTDQASGAQRENSADVQRVSGLPSSALSDEGYTVPRVLPETVEGTGMSRGMVALVVCCLTMLCAIFFFRQKGLAKSQD